MSNNAPGKPAATDKQALPPIPKGEKFTLPEMPGVAALGKVLCDAKCSTEMPLESNKKAAMPLQSEMGQFPPPAAPAMPLESDQEIKR